MDVFIVTGASKGIGKELLQQLRTESSVVYGIARTNPGNEDQFILMDLANNATISKPFEALLDIVLPNARSMILINNAGIVDPIGLAGQNNAEDIEKAMQVNLIAPMVLTNLFINKLQTFTGKKRVLMISSGAGRNPYEGWSTYCTTKAGLDHFTKVVALEQQQVDHPVEIVSIAPGIIDTEMQQTIRSTKEAQFPMLAQFIDYKEQGMLSSAADTAKKLIQFLRIPDFQQRGPIANIRDIT